MQVLYLSYDGLTDPLGQSQVLPYLIGLSAKGAHIHIISFEKPERFEKHKSIIEKIVAENKIVWHPMAYTKRPAVLSTIYDLWRLRKKAKQIVVENKIEIVHCRTIFTGIIGLHLKRKMGVKMIFDMRSFLADERVDGKLWNLQNPLYKCIYKYFKQKEKACLQEANHVISLTQAGKNEMLKWQLNLSELKITVIPCCVDMDLFDPQKIEANNREKVRAELGISNNDLMLIYVGGIGTWYCLDEMMEFFSELKKEIFSAKFLVVTTEKKEIVFQAASKFNIALENIFVTESIRNKVPNYLLAADLALFFILPTYSKMASSPTKQGEMMAMQLPIICNDNVGDTGNIIRKYNAGFVIQKFTKEAYQQVIQGILTPHQFDKNKIRLGAEEYFSLTNGVEKYWQIYQSL